MKVTAQEEYGLRCMMQVASVAPDKPLTVHEIAGRESLSDPYVAKLMNLLKEAGLIESVRGRSGGYFVARAPEAISISEILTALGGHIFEEHYCERFPGDGDECVHIGGCSLRSLWGTLEGLVEQVLRRTTLADLLKSEETVCADLAAREETRRRRTLPLLPSGIVLVPASGAGKPGGTGEDKE